MRNVYHFTDSARLPFILHDGELRPGLNRTGNYPSDFVWATTSDKGSRTASGTGGASSREAYRKGMTRLVRFTFPADAFIRWQDILADHPEWTDADRKRLERSARDLGDHEIASWHCRSEPLPLSEAIRIETRTYTGRWEEFSVPTSAYTFPDGAVGLKLGKLIYVSQQGFNSAGVRGYKVFDPVSPDDCQTVEAAA
jgi:hypothetical protein